MDMPECCATCASLECAKKNPHYGERYKSVYPSIRVKEKTLFGGTREYWKDVPVDHPSNIVGGCQSVWENRCMNNPHLSFWKMGCIYYHSITRDGYLNSLLNFREGMLSAKEERLIRLKYDKEREAIICSD